MSNKWRAIARPIIEKVLSDNESKSDKEIRKALKLVYPFGPKQYQPYKQWLAEIKEQMAIRKSGVKRQVNFFDDPDLYHSPE